jgi:2C-methyl-D-erythritol 2,4-cyclodiphosphate synthase
LERESYQPLLQAALVVEDLATMKATKSNPYGLGPEEFERWKAIHDRKVAEESTADIVVHEARDELGGAGRQVDARKVFNAGGDKRWAIGKERAK